MFFAPSEERAGGGEGSQLSENTNGGKRLAPGENKPVNKTWLLILAGVLAVVICVYLALCAYAHRDAFWKNTSVGGVDISGLTTAQAAERLNTELPKNWEGKTLALTGPKGERLSIETDGLVEPEDLNADLGRAAYGGHGKDANFLGLGVWYLAQNITREDVAVAPALAYTAQGGQRVEELLTQAAREWNVSGKDTVCRYGQDAITLVKGRTDVKVQADHTRNAITQALATGGDEVTVSVATMAPAELDFDSVYNEIFAAASAAYLDKETGEIVPSVTGKSFDVQTARAALDAAEEGEIVRVALDLTVPSPTTEELEAILFRDILGEASTRVTGTADRRMNVGVAADFLNGHIVYPDEEFSFNQICSPYTVDNGYGKATAYVNGLSKDTVAGGICQASSTLYWATLKANLETVERSAHRYEPSYIRGGLDATVYGDYGDEGGLDFRFKNTSGQPIKLEAHMDEKNNLHVLIHGTDTTGVHGEPYSANRVVTAPYKTIYEARESIPQGTTKKDPERTGYNGVSIETYQKLVDAEGKVVEEKLLYKTRYFSRNEVIFFNPADIWSLNIDPVTGEKLAETPAPSTEAPTEENPEEAGNQPTAPAESAPAVTGAPAPAESNRPGIDQPPAVLTPPPEPLLPSQPTPAPYDPDEPLLPPGL